ncbi:methylase of chemotaxis methyl-accepting protein [Bernardetia litoralis DSM 6794]|uniref:Methylase of chemotaxis methyl-accepting protein n=1 Tax=Bernardetia litoralis (strain ATCC 23117 / DSM 6794 / NBRC 15988 / NCIMB 1366 / Fx l1 / Sio-4) TaxID=880071 RepID=I4AN86_BERLS|nr:protein-glutamate O-methyltransferase CheR [Bernardetia litoralis]AFM05421.1 methylase of chemotaxis methyl-accepting protein [Bernardetia litoralis DSM 6794]
MSLNTGEIEIAELRKLTTFIKEKFDYNFKDYAMSSFRRRIRRMLDLYKLQTVDELIHILNTKEGFFEEFVSELTVNVTEMFRDPTFWRVLREHIIPNIMLNHNKISIWHAGCSSGEEIVSMSIVLDEMGILDKAKIVATDIDRSIIAKAKEGRYPLKHMEVNRKNYLRYQGKYSLEKYYTEVGSEAVINKDLLENVSYRKHDLVQGSVFSKFDLVLCRNVMIYFNQTLQNQVLHRLHESLFKYGYLVIGSKESLIWCDIAHKFIVVNNEEKIYKKIKD